MRRTLPLFASLIISSQLYASPEVPLEINIDGVPVKLMLTPRNRAENAAFAHGDHYRGYVDGQSGSWVRLSHIDGQWQGLIQTRTGVHVLDSHDGTEKRARALAEMEAPMQCGADLGAPTENTTLRSAVRETLGNFDTLCNDAIDGICAGVEVEMVFDGAFISTFPSNYEAQAASLLNMVEGFYVDDFGIRLNNLGMTFLDSTVFPDESSSTDYLNEIRDKKARGTLDFVTNPRAILHVVRGKPFTDSTTAGIAWVGGLCNSNGYSSGTSVLYSQTPSGSPSLPLTALVTTHEIGHNLGAKHDTAPEVNCPSGYIMDAMVNPNAHEFSSCSRTTVKGFLGDISGWKACTNYPTKISVVADVSNILTLNAPESIDHRFAINYLKGYATPPAASVTLDMEGASAHAAELGGTPCSLSADKVQVICPLTRSGTLTVTLEPQWTRATVTIQPAFATKDDVFNVADNNGRYEYQFTTPGPASPSELSARLDGNQASLSWQDNTVDETGFEVQRRAKNGEWIIVTTTMADTPRYTDSLPTYGTFEYRVLTLREDINSAPSNIASVIATATSADNDHHGGGGSLGLSGLILAAANLLRRRISA